MAARSKKAETITLGVFGVGEASEKSIIKLVDDYTDGKEVKFIFPVSADHYTEPVGVLADWVREEEIAYEVVVTEAATKDRGLRSLIRDAAATHKVSDVGTAMVNLVKEAEDGRLLMFWDEKLVDKDEDAGAYDALDYADECDVPVFDLCNALEPLSFKEPDSDDAAPDDADDEPEPPKRGRGKASDDAPARTPVDKSLPSFAEASKLGVRALRTMARDLELDSSRAIGSMKIEQVLDLLYKGGATNPAPAVKDADEDEDDEPKRPLSGRTRKAKADDADEDDEPAKPTRRSRTAKAAEPDDDDTDEPAKPAARTRRARGAASLEEQIAEAAHEVTAGKLPVQLNAEAATVLGQFIHLLAVEVASVVIAKLNAK